MFVDLIERLRIAVERRSPKPDMVPRSRLEEAENELTIRNQVRLTSQLCLYLGVSECIKSSVFHLMLIEHSKICDVDLCIVVLVNAKL